MAIRALLGGVSKATKAAAPAPTEDDDASSAAAAGPAGPAAVAPKRPRATTSKAGATKATTPDAAAPKKVTATRKKTPASLVVADAAPEVAESVPIVALPPPDAQAHAAADGAATAHASVSSASATNRPQRSVISITDYKAGVGGAASDASYTPDALTSQHIILRLRVNEPAAAAGSEGDISAFCSGVTANTGGGAAVGGSGGAKGPAPAQRADGGGAAASDGTTGRPGRAAVQSVDTACRTCFWCCHRFEGEITRLPVKVVAGAVMGMGSFCSYECATAFNFHSREILHNAWQSYELINLVAQRNGLPVPVRQAPSRFSLKMFGGPDDITTFRESTRATISLPHPVIPLTHYLEDTYSMERDGGLGARGTAYVPLDHDRVLKAKQNLMTYDQHAKKTGIHSKLGALRSSAEPRPSPGASASPSPSPADS